MWPPTPISYRQSFGGSKQENTPKNCCQYFLCGKTIFSLVLSFSCSSSEAVLTHCSGMDRENKMKNESSGQWIHEHIYH